MKAGGCKDGVKKLEEFIVAENDCIRGGESWIFMQH